MLSSGQLLRATLSVKDGSLVAYKALASRASGLLPNSQERHPLASLSVTPLPAPLRRTPLARVYPLAPLPDSGHSRPN